ncbi:MAG TPA: ACT domain-containing protein [Blastocatellia bacterium]|nr:ACT domain-containing protein [Blastocatellia bacterium]
MTGRKLTLSVLGDSYAICKLSPAERTPGWVERGEFWSVTRTREELSIVCVESGVPESVRSDKGWRCLKVHGPLDFSLTGVLVSLAQPMAQAGVGVFVISTYDTDYLLVKGENLDRALAALAESGHEVL